MIQEQLARGLERILRALAREVLVDGVDAFVATGRAIDLQVIRQVDAERDRVEDKRAVLAEDAGGMGLIHQQHGVVFIRDLGETHEGREVAVHAE